MKKDSLFNKVVNVFARKNNKAVDPEEYLRELISRMNCKEDFTHSDNSTAWHAYREAEKLTDSAFYPALRNIILSEKSSKEKETRQAAYTIFGNLLKNHFLKDEAAFYISRLTEETDKHILSFILDELEKIEIPSDMNIEPIISCSMSEKWLVRQSAIRALGSSKTDESKKILIQYINQADLKKFKLEIIYANASLGRIGDEEDISVLEQHLHSRIRDIKGSAQFAINRINERVNKTNE